MLIPALLIVIDLLSIVLFALLAVLLRANLVPTLLDIDAFSPVRNYLSLWPALILIVLLRVVFGLYPAYGINPAEDLRRQTVSTALIVFFVLAGSVLFRFSEDYSRIVLGLISLMMFVLLPIVRGISRSLLAALPSYGREIWIFGVSERAQELTRLLTANRGLGLKPVGEGMAFPANPNIAYCLVMLEDVVEPVAPFLDQLNRRFRHVWIVPNLLDVASVWISPRDVQGHLALELQNNLLNVSNRLLKRSLDLSMMVLMTLLALPLVLLIMLWVRFDSKGPVFLRQTRLGQDGKTFTVYKFRTMYRDAEATLEAYIESHPEAKREWQSMRKLKHDPRVTRSGKVLRRLSLDELPQLFNIWRGDMAFVGPRPIMQDELDWYGDKAHLYLQVLPGLTGLTQVSGRSSLSYDERARLDAYYVRNWSVWLDLVIISRTVTAVITARGAY